MSERHSILLVDGNSFLRSSVRRMIRKAFPEVVVAETDRLTPALQIVDATRLVLVITGIHLKEGNGLDLTESIRVRYPDAAIMIFTNEDDPEYMAEAFQRGANFFVSKALPNRSTILNVIKDRLSGNRSR